MAQQNGAKLVGLIIARDKFFLRVASAAINAGGEHAEVTDKIHPQIEHLRPEVRDLLVADAFLARHIRAGDKALVASVVPMRLTPHPAHDPIWIKCQVANCINPLFFCFEIFSDRRSMRAGQWRVANQIEIRFCATRDHGETGRNTISALGLNVAQDGFSLESIQAFSHQHGHAVLRKIFRKPRAGFGIEITVQ